MRPLLALAILAFTSAAQAGTIFTVDAASGPGNVTTLTGRLEIDTTTGWINSLDLVLKPFNYSYYDANQAKWVDIWPNDEVHFISDTPGLPASYWGVRTTIYASAHTLSGPPSNGFWGGDNSAFLKLNFEIPSLVGYAGGPISSLSYLEGQNNPIVGKWSGFWFRVNGDDDYGYHALNNGGTLTPLVVPEPSTLALLAPIAAAMLLARKARGRGLFPTRR